MPGRRHPASCVPPWRGRALAIAAMLLAACQQNPPPTTGADARPTPAAQPSAIAAPERASAAVPAAIPDDGEQLLREAQAALEKGDYRATLALCERVRDAVADPREQARALVCVATLRLSPASKMADPQAAAGAIADLEQRVRAHELGQEFFADIGLLRTLQSSEAEMRALRESNRKLAAELAARDQLIRQLRALSVEGN